MSKSQGFPFIPFFVNDAGANPRIILNPLWDPFTTVYIIPIPFKLPPNYQGSGPFFMDQKPGTLLTSSHREWIVTKLRISVLTRSHGSYLVLPPIFTTKNIHLISTSYFWCSVPLPPFPPTFWSHRSTHGPGCGPNVSCAPLALTASRHKD